MDWSLSSIVPIFSTTAVVFGISVGTMGKWIERIGPRASAAFGSVFWGAGLALTGVGTQLHSLPLMYAGYGVLGGLGFAFGYISPLSSMISWFPDKKGLAVGIAIGGFGSGALLCIPASEYLMATYRRLPTLLGTKDMVPLTQEAGRTMAEVGGELKEVVVATADTLSTMPGIVEGGVYLAGSGSTGLGATFVTLSAVYTSLMLTGALGQRLPRAFVEATIAKKDAADGVAAPYVPYETATRLPQFYLLWFGVMGNAIVGASIISCAKTLMSEIFGPSFPLVVDGAFAASFVAGLSVANLGGRLFWPSISDALGRRSTYITFGLLGVPLLLAMPTMNAMAVSGESTLPLWGFVASTSALVSCYGGLMGSAYSCRFQLPSRLRPPLHPRCSHHHVQPADS